MTARLGLLEICHIVRYRNNIVFEIRDMISCVLRRNQRFDLTGICLFSVCSFMPFRKDHLQHSLLSFKPFVIQIR